MTTKIIRDNILGVLQFWQRHCYGTNINMKISVNYDEEDKDNYIVVVITKGEYWQEWYITENEEYDPNKTVEEIGNTLREMGIKLA